MIKPRPYLRRALVMEDDLRILLKENARFLEESVRAGIKLSDDLHVIPVLIKHGAFSPKRLESWNYESLQETALKDESFLNALLTSLMILANKDLQTKVTINEKKAVSFLLAGKDRAPQLVDALLGRAAAESPRFFFIAREYVLSEADWLRTDFFFKLPFPEIRQFGPKFSEKHPCCAEFIAMPSPGPIKELLNSPSRLAELEFIVSLAVSHFAHEDKWIYENVLVPAWASKSSEAARIVLQSLSKHASFAEFCSDKLSK